MRLGHSIRNFKDCLGVSNKKNLILLGIQSQVLFCCSGGIKRGLVLFPPEWICVRGSGWSVSIYCFVFLKFVHSYESDPVSVQGYSG